MNLLKSSDEKALIASKIVSPLLHRSKLRMSFMVVSAGLALLIAQSTTGMAMNMAKPPLQQHQQEAHPDVEFRPVKTTDDVSCQDLDTSEPEPEADTTTL